MRIGVFDSGIGGLTVLKEIINRYPKNQYYYFGDNANLPYGTKSKEELLTFSSRIISFLEEKQVDMVVIACGTVSSNIYSDLKEMYQLPIYDVISPTISYINRGNYQKVGLLATAMTVGSRVFQSRISKTVQAQACSKWVPLIENNQYGQELEKAVYESASKMKETDCIILGCTHYPIVAGTIASVCPDIELVNMGTILSQKLQIVSKGDLSIRLYFSKIDHALIENIDRILNKNYQLEEVNLCQNYQK